MRAMPARPVNPLPRVMRNRIVSAWSSMVWAVSTQVARARSAAAAISR